MTHAHRFELLDFLFDGLMELTAHGLGSIVLKEMKKLDVDIGLDVENSSPLSPKVVVVVVSWVRVGATANPSLPMGPLDCFLAIWKVLPRKNPLARCCRLLKPTPIRML